MPTMKTPFGRLDGRYVNVEGDSMSGALTVPNLIIISGGDIKPSADATNAINIAKADGTDFVTFDSQNARVGIGTDSPSDELHVVGTGRFVSGSMGIDVYSSHFRVGADFPNATTRTDSTTKVVDWRAPHYDTDEEDVLLLEASLSSGSNHIHWGGSSGALNAVTGHSFYTAPNNTTLTGTERMRLISSGNLGINTTSPDRKLDILDASNPQLRLTHTDGSIYTDFQADGSGILTITPSGSIVKSSGSIYPATDDTYYLGKNDDDTPLAWKGVILKDTTNGKYYRIEIISGVITATDLTD